MKNTEATKGNEMTQDQIEARIIQIIERAEYAGHLDGFAIKTRSNREAKSAREGSDLSSKMARKMAAELAAVLAR